MVDETAFNINPPWYDGNEEILRVNSKVGDKE